MHKTSLNIHLDQLTQFMNGDGTGVPAENTQCHTPDQQHTQSNIQVFISQFRNVNLSFVCVLQTDEIPSLPSSCQVWPTALYSMPALVDSVSSRMKRPGGDSRQLWQLLAWLYQRQVCVRDLTIHLADLSLRVSGSDSSALQRFFMPTG